MTLHPVGHLRRTTTNEVIARFAACAWTDDTDQALLIHLGYLHNTARDPPDLTADHLSHEFAARLKIWISQGLLCLNRHAMGIGALVSSIVTDNSFLSNPIEIATQKWIESRRYLAPNGSLMRTHPIGVIGVSMSEEETWKLSVEIGRVTHVDPRCVVSCCIDVAVIRGLLRGDILDEDGVNECIERSYDWVKAQSELMNPGLSKDLEEEDIEALPDRKEFEKHVYAKTLEDLELDDRKGKPLKIGYVYKCLGSAIVLLRLAMRKLSTTVAGNPLSRESLFEDLMIDLIMEGGDADTNGAAVGALVGAYLGYTQLPSHWTLGLAHREWLLKKTGRLAIAIGVESGSLEVEKDEQRDGGVGLMTAKKLKSRDSMLAALREKKREEAAARGTKSAKA
jgi:ADP-ribosylglycohydrolase